MHVLVQMKFCATKLVPLVVILNIILIARILEVVDEVAEGEVADREVKSDLYMVGSQNIDLKDFSLLINTDICDEKDIKIITIVNTALEHKAGIRTVDKCEIIHSAFFLLIRSTEMLFEPLGGLHVFLA